MPPPAPTLDGFVRGVIQQMLGDMRVAQPARVVSYDPIMQAVDVQPLLKTTAPGAMPEPQPIITGVPVIFPRSGEATIYFPINPGDNVLLIHADFSLDKWKTAGGETDPQDTRRHALSDAMAIPGLYPFNSPIPNLDPADIRIVLDKPGIHSEVYLGGDTGDVVLIPQNNLMLGDAAATERAVRGTSFFAALKALIDAEIAAAAAYVSTGVGPGILNSGVLTALNTLSTMLADPSALLSEKAKVQ
jgi:hypothetical protein